MWTVDATDEYLEWFRAQEPETQEALLAKVLLLIGGDKKGKNEKDFYQKLIQTAETLIERYHR
jgi:hypothetical protein